MGTRNLTVVVSNGTHKVAQYCQWDGYPAGQGATVLEFLTKLVKKRKIKEFKNAVGTRTRFIDRDEANKIYENYFGPDSGLVPYDKYEQFEKVCPSLHRNTGARILQLIFDQKNEVLLEDEIEFAKDGLFCEWMYVVDLDRKVLEVYKGIYNGNGIPSPKFPSQELLKTYKFSKLPTLHQFIADFKN